jgi:hypothetical protein
VPGRGNANLPRLPPAAEPEHKQTFTTTICHSDYIDSTTNNTDENLLIANINTTWSPSDETTNNTISDIDLHCFALNSQHDDWIDNFEDLVPCSLPAVDNTNHHLSSDDDSVTSEHTPLTMNALSDPDRQLCELGITRSDFYTNLRSTEDSFLQSTVRAHFDGGSMATTTDQCRCL